MQSNLLHIHADWLPLSHPCPLCWSKQHQPLTCWYHLCHNGKAAWCPKSLSPGFSRPPLIWAVADPWPCLALVFIATDRGLWQRHIFVIIVARMITVIGSLFSVNQKRSVGYDLALNLNQMFDSKLPNSNIENCYIFPTKKKKKGFPWSLFLSEVVILLICPTLIEACSSVVISGEFQHHSSMTKPGQLDKQFC